MAAAAGLAVTLVPVLMGYLIRGRIPRRAAQSAQPRPDRGLSPAARRGAARSRGDARRRGASCCSRPLSRSMRLGGEFMPPLDEGDLLYMPSALPGISAGKAARAAAADRPADQDRAGSRDACSARRAAPRPRPTRRRSRCSRPRSSSSRASSGAPGMTPDKLVEELDRIVQGARPLQHLGAADPQPHRHARHRHQEPGRHQGRRHRPARRSTASRPTIERVVKGVPGVTLGASPSA